MGLTILAIAAFQLYWLQKAYDREALNLEMRTNYLFRETVRNMQAAKLKLDRVNDSTHPQHIIVQNKLPLILHDSSRQRVANMLDVVMKNLNDSGHRRLIITRNNIKDSIPILTAGIGKRGDRLMQFLFEMDSLQDSIKVKELQLAFRKRLDEQGLDVPFSISRVQTRTMISDTAKPAYNEVTLGFSRPVTYRLALGNTRMFLLKRISVPILFSVFLVGFTILSFLLLYRNLVRQRKLADIKNEFISNITHELKTPIATVSVAIEALRSFNASMDPARSKEYLDISANELQRLSLLVDKVLKLSMFEKKEIDLKYEELDMKDMVNEVTSSMRLQFEKHHAHVDVQTSGDTHLEGDRLHLVSVIFNLLDNALKYSQAQPRIGIDIGSANNRLVLTIADSGIGIPQEYQGRIFEKFFRVPTGNLHNAKGYGLGLSYVAHVVNRHNGMIRVESIEGDGSRFIISLPRHKN